MSLPLFDDEETGLWTRGDSLDENPSAEQDSEREDTRRMTLERDQLDDDASTDREPARTRSARDPADLSHTPGAELGPAEEPRAWTSRDPLENEMAQPEPRPSHGRRIALPVAPAESGTLLERAERDVNAEWREEVRHAVTTLAGLESALKLTAAERAGVERAIAGGFPLAITPYYLSLCDAEDPSCPVRIQCVPNIEEAEERRGDMRDPLGEESHEVAKHLVQRYPDRALLLVTDRCSVYCRFCTRSRMVGAGGGVRSQRELTPALEHLRTHPEIRDVIVSGGDPLVMSDARIEALLRELAAIDHVLTVRIASRTPVTLPHRITDALCRALRTHPAPWLMTHFNHPKELTPLAREACARLADHGIPVMNQTVLLRGVNDDAATLEALFRGLIRTRVRPYYLLQADPVRGTSHLRTPLSKGIELIGQLQGRLTGIALPKFIVDTPGGKGKVPVGPDVIVRREGPNTTLRTFRGELVDYVDPDHG